jgi:protein TonB
MTNLSLGFSPQYHQRTITTPRFGIAAPRFIVIGALVVLFLAGIIAVIKTVMTDRPSPQRVVQTITLLPPPPPQIEEKPPEPVVKEEVTIPESQPMQQDEAQAASANLGVDADGTGSGDGFGLQAKKGGRNLLDGGPFGWYGSLLGTDIQGSLAERKKLRQVKYSAVLDLWISKEGRIEKVELVRTSGNSDLDSALRLAVAEVGKVREPPPPEMPQPVRLQVTSRL